MEGAVSADAIPDDWILPEPCEHCGTPTFSIITYDPAPSTGGTWTCSDACRMAEPATQPREGVDE
jgi:hypothetical protein